MSSDDDNTTEVGALLEKAKADQEKHRSQKAIQSPLTTDDDEASDDGSDNEAIDLTESPVKPNRMSFPIPSQIAIVPTANIVDAAVAATAQAQAVRPPVVEANAPAGSQRQFQWSKKLHGTDINGRPTWPFLSDDNHQELCLATFLLEENPEHATHGHKKQAQARLLAKLRACQTLDGKPLFPIMPQYRTIQTRVAQWKDCVVQWDAKAGPEDELELEEGASESRDSGLKVSKALKKAIISLVDKDEELEQAKLRTEEENKQALHKQKIQAEILKKKAVGNIPNLLGMSSLDGTRVPPKKPRVSTSSSETSLEEVELDDAFFTPVNSRKSRRSLSSGTRDAMSVLSNAVSAYTQHKTAKLTKNEAIEREKLEYKREKLAQRKAEREALMSLLAAAANGTSQNAMNSSNTTAL